MENEVCIQCGGRIPTKNKHSRKNFQKYCSYECRDAYYKAKYHSSNPHKGTSTGTTGAISELRVAVDLLSKGYAVFRALSPNSPCDLAILKNGKLLKIEVRTAYLTTSGNISKANNKNDKPQNIDHYAWVVSNDIVYDPELPKQEALDMA